MVSLKKLLSQPARVAGPVARVGQLVRAAYVQDDSPVTLSGKDADKALDILQDEAARIEAAIAAAIGKLDGAEVEKPEPGPEFRRAGRSFALGPIFDFSDMRISIDGFVLIYRFCVTVCVAAKKSLPADSDRSHSKFWLRLRIERGPSGVAALTADEMHAFADLARRVSKAGFRALKAPYRAIISTIADGAVSIGLQQTISVFIANAGEDGSFETLFADDGSFETLFSDADAPGSGADAATPPSSAARELLSATLAVLPEKKKCLKKKDFAQELKKLGNKLEYFNYEDIAGYRGVVVARLLGDHASLVGIAKGPQVVAPEAARSGNAGAAAKIENPANRISGSIIAELASRF